MQKGENNIAIQGGRASRGCGQPELDAGVVVEMSLTYTKLISKLYNF